MCTMYLDVGEDQDNNWDHRHIKFIKRDEKVAVEVS